MIILIDELTLYRLSWFGVYALGVMIMVGISMLWGWSQGKNRDKSKKLNC